MRKQTYEYGNTTVRVFESHVETTLPDGQVVYATPMHDEESVARAHSLGYEGDVVAMTLDHDRLHAALSHALGLPESPALRAAASGGPSTMVTGAEEDMVLAAQRLMNLVGAPFDAAQAGTIERIEAKLDTLIAALDGEDTEEPGTTLDGEQVGGERDQTQGLG